MRGMVARKFKMADEADKVAVTGKIVLFHSLLLQS